MHGIAMDITDHLPLGAGDQKTNMELSARAAEMEAANKELEAFNYTVAHDLRGPLKCKRK